eukprot:TRINITY_DN13059_c0_g1_i1.p1 TRINITY_DN13059_c0_g1~~TRINITY_DN13059_c0_g1_i1.p1  ORF type:complete len:136 (-),score=47.59 TRINITY_DN13059_c0_g1_i1:183-560(-)
MQLKGFLIVLVFTIVMISFAYADDTQVSQRFNDLISDNNIMVFSKSYCPYCKRAKEALTKAGYEFGVVELDVDEEGSQLQNVLKNEYHHRTVPGIFIKSKFIGGSDRIIKAIDTGRLEMMLNNEK